MRPTLAVLLCVLMALMFSCASQEVTSFWRASEEKPRQTYDSVFIMVLTSHRAARTLLEGDLSKVATDHGLKAVRSVDHFPVVLSEVSGPTTDEVMAKAKERGCDAIFTLSLLDVQSEQHYVPGTVGYGTYYSPRYDYYGRFHGYYSRVYPVVVSPGYYTENRTYFVEANLFDVASGEIQWSMQSKAYNPDSIKDFSKNYTKLLVDRLEKENKVAID
ncbi:MAG: hypothetical protein PVH24_02175 [Candidatus Zixiibacteriota bacterium]